ncbi:hypothetical protein J2T56_002439 [Natronobacillus azotifigens]|uniref:Uncharacterized protein n=1 Tax=Natronobacillus azotifigens TaxID=472978 RepID=A0A9J6RCN1_9BACI|nr:hypothetical protein [Natronobacillus azotifigens]MCZ0703269.1 hypothetical protein [Natronobacillus azotifigens]
MVTSLEIAHTTEMEKAMLQNHGVIFAEYEAKLDKRLQVEQEREKSHQDSKHIVNEMQRQVHR